VEVLEGDSQFESSELIDAFESCKLEYVTSWKRLKNRDNLPVVLFVKDRIDVEGSEHSRAVYHRLRTPIEGLVLSG
jgi:hypothetical protein